MIDAAVAATCTETGLTEGKHCSVCGEVLVAQEEVAALGHSYESVVTPPAVGVQGYTTHTCSVCGDSYVDSYTDPLPEQVVLPDGDATLKFASANMTLNADLTVTFWVKPAVLEAYSNVRVEFEIGDKTMVLTDYNSIHASNGRYGYNCTGVAPKMMKDNIKATIYGTFNGEEYALSMDYSAYTYLVRQLGGEAKMRTLAVDLMNYGTYHQLYTGHNTSNLINAELTDEQKAYGTATVRTLNNHLNTAYAVIDNPSAVFKGASLDLENAVIMRMNIECADLTDVSVKFEVDGKEYIVPASEFVPASGTNRYYAYLDKLTATQFSSCVYATIYRGDTVISNTLCYSVESYAYSKQNDTNYAYLAELVKSIIVYGDAAYAYFNK